MQDFFILICIHRQILPEVLLSQLFYVEMVMKRESLVVIITGF